MAKNELTKIVYFDEQTALDYIEIRDKGHYVKEAKQEYEGDVGVKTKATAKTPKLLSMIRLDADVHASAEAKRIVRSTVSNTILTDFIERADKSKDIEHLSGYGIKITDETKLTIYTAITDAANGSLPMDQKGIGIEISNLGSILKNLQGYLEFEAIKDGEVDAILRFNSTSFRNNYHLADIINMSLQYYGVKVGTTHTSTLQTLNLDFTNRSTNVRDEIVRAMASEGNSNDNSSEKKLVIYDVILAGVFNNGTK